VRASIQLGRMLYNNILYGFLAEAGVVGVGRLCSIPMVSWLVCPRGGGRKNHAMVWKTGVG